jgi:hypothetical protein
LWLARHHRFAECTSTTGQAAEPNACHLSSPLASEELDQRVPNFEGEVVDLRIQRKARDPSYINSPFMRNMGAGRVQMIYLGYVQIALCLPYPS